MALLKAVIISGPNYADWKEAMVEDSLGALQSIVQGDVQRLPSICADCANVFMNEEGKFRGDLRVTAEWRTMNGDVWDWIIGPIVVFGPIDDFGNLRSVDNAVLKIVRQHLFPLS